MAIDSFDDDNDGETQDDGGTDGDDDDDDDADVFLFSQAGTESVQVHAPDLAGGPGPLCHTQPQLTSRTTARPVFIQPRAHPRFVSFWCLYEHSKKR